MEGTTINDSSENETAVRQAQKLSQELAELNKVNMVSYFIIIYNEFPMILIV